MRAWLKHLLHALAGHHVHALAGHHVHALAGYHVARPGWLSCCTPWLAIMCTLWLEPFLRLSLATMVQAMAGALFEALVGHHGAGFGLPAFFKAGQGCVASLCVPADVPPDLYIPCLCRLQEWEKELDDLLELLTQQDGRAVLNVDQVCVLVCVYVCVCWCVVRSRIYVYARVSAIHLSHGSKTAGR